ncbi:MAG TPA: DoxX family protein [Pyrinomonadaceae bacterium]|jgi:DoxX.|nr:DoxX family protein [Pyrinomonadaceae bacterium]
MSQLRVKDVTLWIVQILLATFFVLAASGKLMSRPQWIERFRNWGFPDKFYLIIGALELVGAIGLVIPRIAGYAAAGLILIMIGAALTNLINGEGLQVLRPLIFMVFLGLVVYLRRPWASRQSA